MSQFIEMTGDPRTNPKGWPIKKLSELATYSIGLTYKPEHVSEDGTIVLRSGNIQNSKIDLTDLVRVSCPIKESIFVKKNDILMCSRNGSAALVGKVAQIRDINEPMTYGAFMTVIRSEYSDFLYLYFQSNDFREQVSTGKSSTMNQITQNMLDKISLPLPDENTINQLSDILHQADKSEFDGLKSQFIEMRSHTTTARKKVGEVAKVMTGSTPSRNHSEYWGGSNYWVAAQDMGGKYVTDTLEKVTDEGYATCKVVPAGSVLYVCRGSIGVISINTMDCATNQSICTATCNDGYINEYLYYALKFAEGDIKKQGTGTSFKSLNQSSFAAIELDFPSIDDQKAFVEIARQADKSESVCHSSIHDLINSINFN